MWKQKHREGTGIQYDEKEVIKYDGNWKEGKWEGSGKFYEQGSLKYDGSFKVGKKSGKGILYLNYDEDPEQATFVYYGQWVNDMYNGEGV